MSQTQYDFDFEYDTGRTIPRDSAGWQEFHDARKKNIMRWVGDGMLQGSDSSFFSIP